MRFTRKTKMITAAISVAALSIGGAAAFAFWTTSGAGTGFRHRRDEHRVVLHGTARPFSDPGTDSPVTSRSTTRRRATRP